MARIHHATKTRAETLGIILEDKGDVVRAFQPSTGREVTAEDAKIALNRAEIAAKFGHEYPMLQVFVGAIVYRPTEDIVMELEEDEIFDVEDTFSAALDEANEQGFDLEGEEEEAGGSVVKDRYKKEYRARGRVDDNGDWLSETLEPWVTLEDGGLNLVALEAIFDANGVDVSSYNRTKTGWAGRLAMSGRIKLRSIVATDEELIIPSSLTGDRRQTIHPPMDFVEKHLPKKVRLQREKEAKGIETKGE